MVHYLPKGTWATWGRLCVRVTTRPPTRAPASRHLTHQTLPQDLPSPSRNYPRRPSSNHVNACFAIRSESFHFHFVVGTLADGAGEGDGAGCGLGERRRCRVIQCHLRRVPFGHSSTSLATQGSDLKWQTTLESSLPREAPRSENAFPAHCGWGGARRVHAIAQSLDSETFLEYLIRKLKIVEMPAILIITSLFFVPEPDPPEQPPLEWGSVRVGFLDGRLRSKIILKCQLNFTLLNIRRQQAVKECLHSRPKEDGRHYKHFNFEFYTFDYVCMFGLILRSISSMAYPFKFHRRCLFISYSECLLL